MIFIENKDARKVVAFLLVVVIMLIAFVAVASPVAADAAQDIENLTTTMSAMLMAIIPLIITIGIFTLILGIVAFKNMRK